MEPQEDAGVPKPEAPTQPSIKIENGATENRRVCISPDNASSLMIDSDDDYSNENDDDDNMEAWRATERRLSSINDSEVYDCDDDLGISMENKNTQRKTDTDIRIFITYLRSINEFRAPELVQPTHLDRYLSAFFSVVKKHDGNEYEPASLRGMLCSVERYLKIKNYPQSVTRDSAFTNTRNALKFKQQKLRELGKGSKKQPEPFGRLTLDKVNHLFSAHEMGPYTPMSVINTLCFLFIVHFRLRKAIDHKNLLWGDIKLQTDKSGRKFLIYEPVDVQNSIAHSKYDHHGNRLCIWEQEDASERDPIAIYKLYAEKRPQNMKYENSPFYLGITSMQPSPLQAWYRTCAMGVNKLSDLVRMIRDITGLPRATMNAPTEYILSESYGMVSGSKHENNVALVPDTKHSKVFAQNTISPPNRIKIEVDETTEDRSQLSIHSSDDRNEENDDLSEEDFEDPINRNGDKETADDYSSADEALTDLISLSTAKVKITQILQNMDSNDRTALKKWISSSISDGSDSEESDHDEEPSSGKKSSKIHSFPTIMLNIKISPDAITGSSPVSVVADINPVNKKSESKNKKSHTKRKTSTPDSVQYSNKRLKDDESSRPVNLSSNSFKCSSDKISKTVEKFRNMKRTTGTTNTAVVLPRSDKTDSSSQRVPRTDDCVIEDVPTITSCRPIKPKISSNTDNMGYIVPISYPYINPNCFSQDPRVLMNANVIPQMAHSGVNSSFSFLQSTYRNIPKAANQDTD